MKRQKKNTPPWVWTLVKVGVAGCIIAWMCYKDFIRLDDLGRAAGNWPLLLAALAALMLAIFIQSARWGGLLAVQGICIKLFDLFRMTMIGSFFTLVVPGGVGGDAVKAYYVARGREKKAAAATTVLLDRLVGIWTLFLVAGVTVVLCFDKLWNAKVNGLSQFGLPGGRVLVIAIVGGIICMIGFALVVSNKRLRRSSVLNKFSRLLPFRSTMLNIYDAVHVYRNHPGRLLYISGISILGQAPLFLVYYLYGLAIGVNIEPWHCAVIVPPAMVIRMLPLVPGGVGQGAIAMGLLLPLVGLSVENGAAIGAVGDAVFVMTYLVGGLFFVFGKANYREVWAAAESAAPNQSGP